MKKLNALIIGIDSNVGKTLATQLCNQGWEVFGTTRRAEHVNSHNFYVDLEKAETINNINRNFDVIYACAAITNMAFCENNPKISKQVNFDNQVALAQHCIDKTNAYIFLSTAGVFDGSTPNVHPTTKPAPKCNYGRQKATAEQFLSEFSDKITIIRTTKVIARDNKLINSWITSLRDDLPIEPFNNMTLAPVTIDLLIELLAKAAFNRELPIVHISGKTDILYSELAQQIAIRMNKPISLIKPKSYLDAGLTSTTVFPYSSLDMTETTLRYGLRPQGIEDILDFIFME